MYYRREDGAILLKRAPEAVETRVPLDAFDFVSAVSGCADGSLLLTGALHGDEVPSLERNRRGALRLCRMVPGGGQWREIHPGYSHDPVSVQGTRCVAFHNGRGVTVIDEAGLAVAVVKVGQFNWGAPSVSSSPTGKRVAFIKWQGDDQKMVVVDLPGGAFTIQKPTCYRYGWLDDNHILYVFGRGLKVLDLESGASSTYISDLRKLARQGLDCQDEDMRDLLLGETKIEAYDFGFGGLQRVGETVCFDAQVMASRQSYLDTRLQGLCSVGSDRKRLKLLYLCPAGHRLRWFDIDPIGNAVIWLESHKGTRIVGHSRVAIGPDAAFLNAGWDILRMGTVPEFGFHVPLQAMPAPRLQRGSLRVALRLVLTAWRAKWRRARRQWRR